MRGLLRCVEEPDAVDDHGIAGKDVEQQDPLDYLGEIERNFDHDFRVFTTDEGERQKKSCDQYSDRIKSTEKRDDNRSEAVTRRNVGLQMTDRTCNLDNAGEFLRGRPTRQT